MTLLSDQPSTRLLIYAPAALQRAAWRALLSDQPGITTGVDHHITEIGNSILWLLAEASHTYMGE